MQLYNYTVVRDKYYEFTTEADTSYACYFLAYTEYFKQYKEVADYVFGFNIEVISGKGTGLPQDDKIGFTVIHIIKSFLESLENAVIYVCDSSDGKELLRKRKFDSWFARYDDGTVIKVDGQISVEDFHIFNAILIHKDNPHKNKFIAVFSDLNYSAGNK